MNDNNLLSEIQKDFVNGKKKPRAVKKLPEPKRTWKSKVIIGAVIGLVLTIVGYKLFMVCVDYVNAHEFVKNQVITLKAPITIKKKEPQVILSPLVLGSLKDENEPSTKEEKALVIKSARYPVVLAGVWNRESTQGENSSGHHKYCVDSGYSNEFGYNVYGNNKTCFTGFREAVDAVDSWFQKELKSYSLDQALCLYNTGTASDNCTYQMNYRADEDRIWAELSK